MRYLVDTKIGKLLTNKSIIYICLLKERGNWYCDAFMNEICITANTFIIWSQFLDWIWRLFRKCRVGGQVEMMTNSRFLISLFLAGLEPLWWRAAWIHATDVRPHRHRHWRWSGRSCRPTRCTSDLHVQLPIFAGTKHYLSKIFQDNLLTTIKKLIKLTRQPQTVLDHLNNTRHFMGKFYDMSTERRIPECFLQFRCFYLSASSPILPCSEAWWKRSAG